MIRSTSLFLTALANLSLLACAGEPAQLDPSDDKSDTPSEPGDLVRFEIEVVGEGQVAVLEPYVETCTTEDGICTFSFERGTRVVFTGEFATEVDDGFSQECLGHHICAVDLTEDLTWVADFEFSGHRIEGHRTIGFLPGQPWIIVDPFPEQDSTQTDLIGAGGVITN